MAKLYHKNTAQTAAVSDANNLLVQIETFLAGCRTPAALEYGEESLPLVEGEYAVEIRSSRVWIDVWDETRSLSRRILSAEQAGPGILDCTVHRFGGKPGKLTLLDLDRPQTTYRSVSGMRQNFAERFRRMLFRQFPGWEIATLACGMDLQRSFSAIFPRARLIRGNQQIAALACPSAEDEPSMLTFALIWFDYVRAHSRRGVATSMCLFLPETAGNLTSHRLRWLTGQSFQCRMFRFNEHGSAGEVDARDLGNLQTRVKAAGSPAPEVWSAAGSERVLETLVRRNITLIDPMLRASPVHAQTLAFAAGDRDAIDLLAVASSGRLAVLELKVSEDLHLPIQALDYWMRVRWHAERGELRHLFPEVPLAGTLPKLLLVAPAMSFHSSNTAILRYFSPEIEVERVGINSDWERQFKVVLRLSGADMPISHGSFE